MRHPKCFIGLISLFFIFVLFQKSHAQPDLLSTWSTALNNHEAGKNEVIPTDIKVDAAGNTYITGNLEGRAYFSSSLNSLRGEDGKEAIFIAKYNASNTLQYAKLITGTPYWFKANALEVDANGNIFICGFIRGTADFDPDAGVANITSVTERDDIFIAKYNSTGALAFANRIGGIYDDIARDIAIDGAGNIAVTGSFQELVDFAPGGEVENLTSLNSSYDIFLATYNNNGGIIYAQSMGGFSYDAGSFITIAANSIIIGGSFAETTYLNPYSNENLISNGEYDFFIARYDLSGNFIFGKNIGGFDDDYITGMTANSSGIIAITGTFYGTVDFNPGAGTNNLENIGSWSKTFLARYNMDGNYISATGLYSTQLMRANDILLDEGGNSIVFGLFSGTVDFDAGPGIANLTASQYYSDTYFAKYDGAGNYLAAYNFGNTNNPQFNGSVSACKATKDQAGNFVITRNFAATIDLDPGIGTTLRRATKGFTNAFCAKYNTSGSLLSDFNFGGRNTATLEDEGKTAITDAQGNVYLFGSFMGTISGTSQPEFDSELWTTSKGFADVFFAKYNANGNLTFVKGIGSEYIDYAGGMALDALGNIYITGSFQGTADFNPTNVEANLTGAGGTDIFIAKYTNNGTLVWAKTVGGVGPDAGEDIKVDASGNIYVTGSYRSAVDFDPGAGVANLASNNNSLDVFLAKYSTEGNFIFAKSMGGAGIDYPTALALDPIGTPWLTGHFEGSTASDFDPGPGTANLFSNSSGDIFLAKYTPAGEYIFAKKLGGPSGEEAHGLAIDGVGQAYIIGDYSDNPVFGTTVLSSQDGPIFMAKYDAAGTNIFAKSIGGLSTNGSGYGITTSCGGSIWITGRFYNYDKADFDPGPGIATLKNTSGNVDAFVAKYDAEGDFVYAKNMGGTGGAVGNSIATDASGNAWVTGRFFNMVDFNPGEAIFNLQADNNADIWLAKLNETITHFKSYVPGAWNNPATWGACRLPLTSSVVTVDHNVNVTANTQCKTLTVSPIGAVHVAPGIELKVLQ